MLDTNAVLRFLLEDDEEKAACVQRAIEHESCLVPVEVLAEAVYVLTKFYHVERSLIQQKLLGVLKNENVTTTNQKVVETALRYYGETKLDFVDCLMIGYAIIDGHQILTFDNELKKILGIATEPQS